MEFKIYKLHFTTPLHLGDARDDYSISLRSISSDTMYAALTSCIAKLGKENDIKNGDLNCSISSLFPFYQKSKNSTPILFFPKPLMQKQPQLKDLTKAKMVKKVSWIDKKYFEKIINGEDLFSSESDIDNINDDYLTTCYGDDFDSNFIFSQVSPRVSVSRNGEEDAKPFYMERIFFKDYSGLYFIVHGDTSIIENALDLLQTEGIGTDRNVGNGFFEYEKDYIELTVPENQSYCMSLSSYIPESKEQLEAMLNGENVAYDIVRIGGWITTPPYNSIRKNVIYAFTAGSIFFKKVEDIAIYGKIVDLKPELPFEKQIEHPVWRYGKSIFIPVKL